MKEIKSRRYDLKNLLYINSYLEILNSIFHVILISNNYVINNRELIGFSHEISNLWNMCDCYRKTTYLMRNTRLKYLKSTTQIKYSITWSVAFNLIVIIIYIMCSESGISTFLYINVKLYSDIKNKTNFLFTIIMIDFHNVTASTINHSKFNFCIIFY